MSNTLAIRFFWYRFGKKRAINFLRVKLDCTGPRVTSVSTARNPPTLLPHCPLTQDFFIIKKNGNSFQSKKLGILLNQKNGEFFLKSGGKKKIEKNGNSFLIEKNREFC